MDTVNLDIVVTGFPKAGRMYVKGFLEDHTKTNLLGFLSWYSRELGRSTLFKLQLSASMLH